MPKTILINFSNSFFVRNFLRTDALTLLRESREVRLVLLAPREKLNYYKKEFPYPELIFDELPNTRHTLIERFFRFLETSSIHTHTVTMISRYDFVRSRGAKAWINRALIYILRRALWQLGGFRSWRNFIRAFYYFLPTHTFRAAFRRYKPDLVFCPTTLYHDLRIVKEAKKAGIPSIAMIHSWDNLYSKTFIRVHPDRLIAHTDVACEQAYNLGDYPKDRVVVTGVPQYDRYFRKADVVSRDEFIRKLGGDPAKKLVVYAMSGKGSLWIDFEILEIIYEAIRRGEISESIEVLLRAHPKLDLSSNKIKMVREKFKFLAHPSTSHVNSGTEDWEFDEESVRLLSNTLAHADLVISMYTTFFIEAAIFDKPLLAIGFDGQKKRPYWDSAERFFEWDHLREIREANGIWHVYSREELIRAINEYIAEPKRYGEGRRRIIEKQTQFTDGRSAERLGQTILDTAFIYNNALI